MTRALTYAHTAWRRPALLRKQLVGRGDDAGIRMRRAKFAELLGIGDELLRVDHRRIVFAPIVTVHPGQDHADIVFVGGLEFGAGPGREIDERRRSGRAAGEKSDDEYADRARNWSHECVSLSRQDAFPAIIART